MRCCILSTLIVLLVSVLVTEARAQDSTRRNPDSTAAWYDDAWTHIVTKHGVHFGYLFYSNADNENNGVVLRLQNGRDEAVRYAFTILFRGPEAEATARTEGTLQPGQMKTGDEDGLFWIPFSDGKRVGEVGLRGIDVTPLDKSAPRGSDQG